MKKNVRRGCIKALICMIMMLTTTPVFANFGLDESTLIEGETITLIHNQGCGSWTDFNFLVADNQINAQVSVTERWFQCNVDPLPPKFWNRIPLTILSPGLYELNLTLSDGMTSEQVVISFLVRGAVEQVDTSSALSIILMMFMMVWIGIRHMMLQVSGL